MRITEQVVQIAQNFLISTDQEEAHIAGFIMAQLWHWQRIFDTHTIHVLFDRTVGITGNIHDYTAAGRLLIQTAQWHDWEDLINPPGIWQ